jgi:hypothetical protein
MGVARDPKYTMNKPALLRPAAALLFAGLLLAGCGGGGDGPAGTPTILPTTSLGPSSQYEGTCDLETQKRFVRSYLDEVYFWYSEIPAVDSSRFNNIPDYFDALLVRTPDVNGLPKDRFSAVIPASQAQGVLQQSFAPQPRALDLLANHTDAVPVTKVVTSGTGRRVGYVQFNDHEAGAQDDLIAAFRQLQAAGPVQDLVLDLRINSGGFLYVALTAASMITGPENSGRVFERLQYNDKRPLETATSTLFFSSTVQFPDNTATAGPQNPVGTPLPQLGLTRVFVLTSGSTCSASESIINSLRGIGVQVIRIGTTTCGKPYGFRQKNNCGLAYFPIEFKGTNAQGFGDYTTGFAPTCQVTDDPASTAGSATDPLLNGALTFIDTNACPAGTATGVQSAATPKLSTEKPTRPAWAGRLLLPQQQH